VRLEGAAQSPACEHVFVTSHGSAYGRFTRSVQQGNVFQAEIAARELGMLTLGDALRLVVLYAEKDSAKFDPAAVKWLRRLLEERATSLRETELVVMNLLQLPGEARALAAEALARLLHS
jgi:hypothetical protein